MWPDEPLPERITVEWIEQQDSPYFALVDFIINLLNELDEKEMPAGLYNLWLIRRFETDVDNGGFGQFMGNAFDSRDGSDLFFSDTLPAVRALGLGELEPLVLETFEIHKAIQEFDRLHSPPCDLNRAVDKSTCRIRPADPKVQAFEEATEARFDDLYERFAALDYSWQPKLDRLIKEQPRNFVYPVKPSERGE
jgi:hypothetical protein